MSLFLGLVGQDTGAAPTAPTGLTGTTGGNYVILNWTKCLLCYL